LREEKRKEEGHTNQGLGAKEKRKETIKSSKRRLHLVKGIFLTLIRCNLIGTPLL
jgi:hypothetical protein